VLFDNEESGLDDGTARESIAEMANDTAMFIDATRSFLAATFRPFEWEGHVSQMMALR